MGIAVKVPHKFPSRYLTVEGEWVRLHLPPGSTIDFARFEDRVQRALAARDGEALAEALTLYDDDLFPGDRYADWSAAARERLSQRYLRALAAAGNGCTTPFT